MSFSSHRPSDIPVPAGEIYPASHVPQPYSQPDTTSPRKPSFFVGIKDDLWAALLEYVGTTIFLLLAFGGVQAAAGEASASEASSEVSRIMYISLCFGFSLIVSAWLFYRVTGGLFNPDVSLALLLTGIIGPVRFVLYCIAQLVGGITAAAIVLALSEGPIASNVFLGPGVNPAQGVFIEMFTTSILVLAVLMMAAEKHQATPFAPVGIGLTLFMGHMWSIYFTGAGINTARAFGPAVVSGFPYGTQWVYWVGPFLGALLGSAFYMLLKHIKYWRFNPGQDTIDYRESPRNPVNHLQDVVYTMRRGRAPQDVEDHRTLHDGRVSGFSEKRAASTSDNGTVVHDGSGSTTVDGSHPIKPNDSAV